MKQKNLQNQPIIDPKLLESLVCPVTKTPLKLDSKKNELVSNAAKLAFSLRDGMPFMLVDEARQIKK